VAVRRVLATVYVGHFSVELSSVTARFGGAEPSANTAALEFSQLAASRRSGGIADLVRAGHAIPGARGRPPANAYYDVTYLVDHIDAIYAWYGTRPASTHGWKSLAQLEHDFSFSRLVS